MSKPIGDMTPLERERTVLRRLLGPSRGLGYWAAFDANKKFKYLTEEKEEE